MTGGVCRWCGQLVKAADEGRLRKALWRHAWSRHPTEAKAVQRALDYPEGAVSGQVGVRVRGLRRSWCQGEGDGESDGPGGDEANTGEDEAEWQEPAPSA